jgi:uncharacterized membrane protein SpoIIM required for sporulation
MRQDQFVSRHESEWQALAAWLEAAEQRKAGGDAATLCPDVEVPRRYRRLCQQLALARRRGYSPMLVERLGQLTERAHTILYRPPNPRWWRAISFIASDFPAEVRAQWGWMLVSAVLLFAPMLAMIVLVQAQPDLAYSVFDLEQLAQMEQMYDPAEQDRLGRDSGTDLMMFGHYIMNNISIGFRSFASGLLVGLGSILVLVSNGVMIGTVAGHLTGIGYGGPFWRFVVGHSAPELLAIVISGGAGMRLGFALIAPGQLSRVAALLAAGRIGARLILGVFVMLLAAAFIEAFWSSIASLPDLVKFGSGGLIWLVVLTWLGIGGRGRVHAH